MKKELEELTDEIRKLRREVKELREAGSWVTIRYVPIPTYVPPYIPYQQPYTPWWGTITSSSPGVTVSSYGPILDNTTTTHLPANTQLSLT